MIKISIAYMNAQYALVKLGAMFCQQFILTVNR